jgi:hypothetical protein
VIVISVRLQRWLNSPVWLSLVFFLSLPAVTHRLNASDEIEYFAWLRSAAFDRDVDFDNEYRHFYEAAGARDALFHETFLERVNENGRRHNFAPIGTAVLWSPFFATAHVLAGLLGYSQDGYSQPYLYAVTLASAVYGWLALILSMSIITRLTGHGAAVWAVWLGTPLLFYMYVAPGFSHACSAFSVALMMWVWLRVRDRWSVAGALQLGLVSGLLPMVREQDVFLLIGPIVDFLRWALLSGTERGDGAKGSSSHRWTSAVWPAVTGLAAFAIVYAPQVYAYVLLNGHPGPDATVRQKMTWSSPHLFEVLFSPRHGFLTWTPLAFVASIGLIRIAGRRRSKHTRGADIQARRTPEDLRWIAFLALLMFASQAYISGSVESWTVAGSFGQRRFVSLTPILALGLALWRRPLSADATSTRGPRPARGWYWLVLCLSVWWNVGLIVQFGLHRMDRQRLTLAENARFTFLELPVQAPAILVRYLTNRDSFYRVPRQ